ncbi:low temperature requirement protein A [Mycolicibacterium tokaiense]|uniref:Low temperature requirement A n=1 Tax=Mycolicibacterium tokaiense TaxID=39695 RepID=A0A378THD3_9MYCO|nr:low temperature requirement protein A [Mycolicibacterium tokaiense]BBY85450.1 membrane protein [Mycolicibacterium tokaiense]STZ60040.1 low temperature requirement A [Mycolicibacterium tokaiense]
MSGRDPHEAHRVATPLELLFDLTFVIAFGVAASELAHMLAENHLGAGLAGFAFATFAVSWAWINFSWFASAYDTDDWVYRLTTMLQMVGVVVLALGIPPVYSSIYEGRHVDNRVLVAGYVVMRVAMVLQWLRAARQDPTRRRACLTYAVSITVAQVGWIAVIVVDTSVPTTFLLVAAMTLVEMSGPWLAEKRMGGTPWHSHHIAERYGLLVIIALGEGVIGTVATLTAVVHDQGWTFDAASVVIAGIGLTFGMWWVYFVIPTADLLHARRERSFPWGYSHILVFGSIVATGAGLHAAAYYLERHSTLDSMATVLAVAIPVGVYLVLICALYVLLVGHFDLFHAGLLTVAGLVLAGAVILAGTGVDMAVCLLVVTLAPAVTVLGYELVGHRRATASLGHD